MFSPTKKKNAKQGFTLIEMLIVIVIIGILIAALVPRLSSARGRANDIARKADLAQVGVALVAYQIDHAKFPQATSNFWDLKNMSSLLISVGINGVPSDPMPARIISYGITWFGITTWTDGQYQYVPVIKGGIDYNGFVLMAKTETEGGSNRVSDANTGWISSGSTAEDVASRLCKSFVWIVTWSTANVAAMASSTGVCVYNKNGGDNLRYIYIY